MTKPKIAICSSAAFYKHVNEITDRLNEMGWHAIEPLSAKQMRESGNYDTSAVKTWYDNPEDFDKKQNYIDRHIDEIKQADVILLVNDMKNEIDGYIGGNGLIEMAIAYDQNMPIYVLNDVGKEHPFFEEVFGMGAIIIKNRLELIKKPS